MRQGASIRLALLAGILSVSALSPPSSLAQGCTQCRDNTAAMPPSTQHAYRTAILILAGTATCLCSAAVAIGRRFR